MSSNQQPYPAYPAAGYYPSAAEYPEPSLSKESGDAHHRHMSAHKPYAMRPPPYGTGYPPSTRVPNQLRSVVTTSFSVDEERDGVQSRSRTGPYGREDAPSQDERHTQPEGREGHVAARDGVSDRAPVASLPARIPQSPQRVSASFDHGRRGNFVPPRMDPLKRSFWHHANPEDANHGLHPAFMPPKRAKTSKQTRNKEVSLMPQNAPHRSSSWGGPQGRDSAPSRQRPVQQSMSFPAAWGEGGYASGRMNEGPAYGAFQGMPRPYHESHHPLSHPMSRTGSFPMAESYWAPYSNTGIARSFSGSVGDPRHSFSEDMMAHQGSETSRHAQVMQNRRASGDLYAMHNKGYEAYPPLGNPTTTPPTSQAQASSAIVSTSGPRKGKSYSEYRPIDGPIKLLAQPEDDVALSETLCIIRENVEVFIATEDDVAAPAPGRKHPVVVDQVGLRCIHCRHTVKSSDRVKRAVCYPSSIQRIYRTVIDMKLDHFLQCQFVPAGLKHRLNELKQVSSRSTGTTMQYFVRSAQKMGLVNGPSGVRMADSDSEGPVTVFSSTMDTSPRLSPSKAVASQSPDLKSVAIKETAVEQCESSICASRDDGSRDSDESVESREVSSYAIPPKVPPAPVEVVVDMTEFMGKSVLSVKEDKASLSPLRCFLRENVCAFSATEADIAVRTPTTFSVVVGQVGIGCIHCHSLPAKERSNRAVCFPFSVSRIYQSVADIQRFHFGECRHVPPAVRQRFVDLQSQSTKGSKGLATRQYWVTSAKKIGLADTPHGIRFGRDPSVSPPPAVSLDILAQVASNVNTTPRQVVTLEDKSKIAQFLYVVMEQLKVCRFTEADRNKRRLKDVGCIGVECKHCAGTVEGRKFFWSSVSAVESNFVSVHTHMMECKMVPDSLKQQLADLKKLRKAQTASLKVGSQKAFFARVWNRLHGEMLGAAVPVVPLGIKREPTIGRPAALASRTRDEMAIVPV